MYVLNSSISLVTETQKEKHMIYHKNHNKIAMDEVEFISNGTSSKPETVKQCLELTDFIIVKEKNISKREEEIGC